MYLETDLRAHPFEPHSPPAPEPGGFRVHTDVSPVLAQTFTEPFVVFSAKRFPGVPGKEARRLEILGSLVADVPSLPSSDTTALSIALGNQGQKLPLVSQDCLSCAEPSLNK